MSKNLFKPTIWSALYNTITNVGNVIAKDTNGRYSSDAKNAKTVLIHRVDAGTIGSYVPGTPIDWEEIDGTEIELKLDQAIYFAAKMDDVDKVQSTPNLMKEMIRNRKKGMVRKTEQYLSGLTASVDSGMVIPCAIESDKDALDALDEARIKLFETKTDENGNEYELSPTDDLVAEVSPRFYVKIVRALTELATENADYLKNGRAGMYGNILVKETPLLRENGGAVDCMVRTKSSIAFVEQLRKVKAVDIEDEFAEGVKGLSVFGAKIIKPEELVVLRATFPTAPVL